MKTESLLVLLVKLMLVLVVMVPFVMGALAVKHTIAYFEQAVTERTSITS